MPATSRTEFPTTVIERSSDYCSQYAGRKDLTLPLRAEVNIRMTEAICGSAKERHAMVQKAYEPLFGRMRAIQAKFGPRVV